MLFPKIKDGVPIAVVAGGVWATASAIALILAIMIFIALFILLRKVIRASGAEHT